MFSEASKSAVRGRMDSLARQIENDIFDFIGEKATKKSNQGVGRGKRQYFTSIPYFLARVNDHDAYR